ncbi:Fic family protein [Candidatus Falkowbacteria bacterium]|nr:Fic family protein [Candidatus Falkowbacteria bacterium]
MFNPQYKINNKMVNWLTAIAEAKVIIDRAKLLPQHELKLRRRALVRMTHSSTAIEGNMLTTRQIEDLLVNKKIDAPRRDIFEVQNYLKALKYIQQVVEKKISITEKIILKIHQLVTADTLPEEQSGHYRQGPIYVVRRRYGQPQEIVYTGPAAKKVPGLMKDLVTWLSPGTENEIHPIIVAGIVHQEIAAIHPFADGNGRTARALATLILYKRGYDFRRLFALEDYYNQDRPKYYAAINIGKNYEERKVDFTPWLEYFVKGFKQEIDEIREKIISLSLKKMNDEIQSKIYLDKDQMQILDFLDQVGKITVQDVVNILRCPKRTAQSYLQKLKKLGIIKQVGKGPASGYMLM